MTHVNIMSKEGCGGKCRWRNLEDRICLKDRCPVSRRPDKAIWPVTGFLEERAFSLNWLLWIRGRHFCIRDATQRVRYRVLFFLPNTRLQPSLHPKLSKQNCRLSHRVLLLYCPFSAHQMQDQLILTETERKEEETSVTKTAPNFVEKRTQDLERKTLCFVNNPCPNFVASMALSKTWQVIN